MGERGLVMFLDVEWTDQDGRHQGELTNELKAFQGKPIILAARGRRLTAADLGGIRVRIVSTKTEAADILVQKAQADGYVIGW